MNKKVTIITLVMGAIFVAIYLFIIKPQQNKDTGKPVHDTVLEPIETDDSDSSDSRTSDVKSTKGVKTTANSKYSGRKVGDDQKDVVKRKKWVREDTTVDQPYSRATFTNQGGNLVKLILKTHEKKDHKSNIDMVGKGVSESKLPLNLEFEGGSDFGYNSDARYQIKKIIKDEKSGRIESLSYVWNDVKGRVSIEKEYTFYPFQYYFDLKVHIKNLKMNRFRDRLSMYITSHQNPEDRKGGLLSGIPNIREPICMIDKSVERGDDDIGKRKRYRGRVSWAGIDQQFFISVAIPMEKSPYECEMAYRGRGRLQTKLTRDNFLELNKGEDSTLAYRIYIGPKNLKLLEKIQVTKGGKQEVRVRLDDSVNFWILGFLCKPMLWILNFFYSIFGNYGLAIIFLTILVKLLLLPFTTKSFQSMKRMQNLKPLMDELREKYKNDKQKMNQEMMALYKTHKVNPLGGCLPMLLQMPIWIALYRTLYASADIYQAHFMLWITDLTSKDPYYIFPILLGITMFLQQKLSPTTIDSKQAKIFLYVMPLMFMFFMLSLPSGLVLYIFVNTVLSIVHQWHIGRKMS